MDHLLQRLDLGESNPSAQRGEFMPRARRVGFLAADNSLGTMQSSFGKALLPILSLAPGEMESSLFTSNGVGGELPNLTSTQRKSHLNGFMVTEEWIHQNKTGRGGWNCVQLAAIGVSWPPTAGWTKEVVGSLIPLDHKRIFESQKGVRMSGRMRRKLERELIENLNKWRGD